MNYRADDEWRREKSIARAVGRVLARIAVLLFGDILSIPSNLRQWNEARKARPRAAVRLGRLWTFSLATYLPNILIAIWIYTLAWGEYRIFDQSIRSCDWDQWEDWPAGSAPHRLAYVADPQLVDPHTYPGRPWPLSTLTVSHTDIYLRRAYSRIQRQLDPGTIFFLGDLFDGGREWSTGTTESQDPHEAKRYRKHGDLFWQHEFDRFSNIFLTEWNEEERMNKALGDRRVVASLPGNHDLGFGNGIQKPVRDRFQAFFGDGNRIDIIANHTFLSIDSVSLSAKDRLESGSQRNKDVWQPADDFLASFKARREEAVEAALGGKKVEVKPVLQVHKVEDIIYHFPPKVEENKPPQAKREVADIERSLVGRDTIIQPPDFPTVLLTHVPLYRLPGTPCGPMRERSPPKTPSPGQTEPVNPDYHNAIRIGDGYQYQNVMSESLTKEIISSITSGTTGDLQYVFSGDDHDYCEITHKFPFHPGVTEITVKSISWAMGVRKPGFLLASMWNPVDKNGQRLPNGKNGALVPTMQTHLCLLPDEIGTLIQYGLLLGFCSIVLLVRALIAVFSSPSDAPPYSTQGESLSWRPVLHTFPVPAWLSSSAQKLSTGNRARSYSSAEREKRDGLYSSNVNDRDRLSTLASSSTGRRSPARSRGGNTPIPLVLPTYAYGTGDVEAEVGEPFGRRAAPAGGKMRSIGAEVMWTLWYVARVVLLVYIWMLRH